MRSLVIFSALLAVTLTAGCGKQPETYGNFANVQSSGLVEDAVGILKTAYPPAKTRLNLMHRYGDDAFGSALVETLRREGYAIAEYVQPLRSDKYAEAPANPDGFAFGYVVDHLTGDAVCVCLCLSATGR
jgi:hypothetical protein